MASAGTRNQQSLRVRALDQTPRLASLLTNIVDSRIPTTIIICSTREAFVENLRASLNADEGQTNERGECHVLLLRALQVIAATRRVRLVFCPSVPVLWAHLMCVVLRDDDDFNSKPVVMPQGEDPESKNEKDDGEKADDRLVLLDALKLHIASAHDSAQGLGRTVSAAVRAAWITGRELVMVEAAESIEEAPGVAVGGGGDDSARGDVAMAGTDDHIDAHKGGGRIDDRDSGDNGDNDEADEMARAEELRWGTEHEHESGQRDHIRHRTNTQSPWERRLQVIGRSTKTFGVGGGGGRASWMDRTVPARNVVGRWCVFDNEF